MSTPDRTPDTGHDADRLTAQDAAARIGVSERTVRRAIASGDLAAVKRHGAFRIALAELLAWDDWRRAARRPGSEHETAARGIAELTQPVTSLVGRERELATASVMLRREDVRLLTLTGAGGIGKTRLALEVAARLAAEFADGAHVVPLAEVPDAGLVAAAIAEHLDLPETGAVERRSALVAALRELHALLVMDNFEHVLDAAPLVSELLRSCPRLKILVTSRSLLRVGGEQALPVPPLELPATGSEVSVAQADASPAVRLFVDRARAVAPAFALTASNVPAVVAICQRLAGLPLAIELVASQVTVLPPDTLLARIEAHQPMPLAGPRDVPDRQRTMTNAIAWSYTLLGPDAQRLFRRIAVFAGAFAVEAAKAVGDLAGQDAPHRSDTLATIAALVEASLVQQATGDEARFTMLEPIRAFALERLATEGELDATFDALADWCLALVEHSPMAESVPGGERYLARLDTEHPNLRRTLEWLHQRQDPDRLMRLAAALGGYWYERTLYREGRMWMERALAIGASAAPYLRGRVMAQMGLFLGLLADSDRARDLIADGVALLRDAGEPEALALALVWQGAIANLVGDYDLAEAALTEALERAASLPERSRGAAMRARAMSNLGATAHARGNLDAATRWHGQALAVCREHGYLIGTVRALVDLADVTRDRGDYTASLASYREALGMLGERSDLRLVLDALVGAALAAATWGRGGQAARLVGAVEGLIERFSLPPLLSPDREAHDRAMRATRELVGEPAFDRNVAAGRQLSLSDAIAEVMACVPPPPLAPADSAPGGPLTPREQEVLRLLAAGRRDREIADALFISVRTVEGHVTRIFGKLEVSTRVEAARAAAGIGLAEPVSRVRSSR